MRTWSTKIWNGKDRVYLSKLPLEEPWAKKKERRGHLVTLWNLQFQPTDLPYSEKKITKKIRELRKLRNQIPDKELRPADINNFLEASSIFAIRLENGIIDSLVVIEISKTYGSALQPSPDYYRLRRLAYRPKRVQRERESASNLSDRSSDIHYPSDSLQRGNII